MRLRIALMLSVSLLCGVSLADDKPLDVRDVMTANQFHATALDKLAPAQLSAFDAWLAGYGQTPVTGKALDVRDLMTATQFHAAGLDQLSPEQLTAFNTWLAGYGHASTPAATPVPAMSAPVVTAPTPAPASGSATGSFGQQMLPKEVRNEPDRIESRILGKFTGWNGRTTFHLENGQVWQQADSSTSDLTLQDPQVVIKRLGFGYLLTFPGHGATVFVRRVH